jgi:hypothetical protein
MKVTIMTMVVIGRCESVDKEILQKSCLSRYKSKLCIMYIC